MQALEEEYQLSEAAVSSAEEVGIQASADAGWQKRGSGRSYSSLSGHCSLIGSRSDKVIAFEVRNKQSRICETYKKSKKETPDHDCRKNWSGPAKAMESDMVVSMLKKEGTNKIKVLALDNDSTTCSRIKDEVPRKIKDIRDMNHTKKNLSSHLRELQKKHPCITDTVIRYLQTSLAYAIKGSDGDAELTRASISNIVNHAFGHHQDCGEWCGFHKNPQNYKHNHFPMEKIW